LEPSSPNWHCFKPVALWIALNTSVEVPASYMHSGTSADSVTSCGWWKDSESNFRPLAKAHAQPLDFEASLPAYGISSKYEWLMPKFAIV